MGYADFVRGDIPFMTESPVFQDERGTFCPTPIGQNTAGRLEQFNVSISSPGVFRGMHHQKAPHTQAKRLTLIRGRIVDFVVSIREENFGETFVFEMTPGETVHVPKDYLHGFYVYDNEEAIVQYMVDNDYSPEHEISVDWKSCPVVKEWVEKDAETWGYDIESRISMSDKDSVGVQLETLNPLQYKETEDDIG